MFLLTKMVLILQCCVAVHSDCTHYPYTRDLNNGMKISIFISPFETKNLFVCNTNVITDKKSYVLIEWQDMPCKATEYLKDKNGTFIDTSSFQHGWNQILVTFNTDNMNQLSFFYNNASIYQLTSAHYSMKIKLDLDAAFYDCSKDTKNWNTLHGSILKVPLIFFNGTSQLILRATGPLKRFPFLSINSVFYSICYDGTDQLYLSTKVEEFSCSHNLKLSIDYVLPLSSELFGKSISKINSITSTAEVVAYINNYNMILKIFYEHVNQKKYKKYRPKMLKDDSIINPQINRANTHMAGLLFLSLIGNIAIAVIAVYIFVKMKAKATIQQPSQNMSLQRGQLSASGSKPERNSETYSYEIYNESFNPEGQNEKRH